MKTYNFINLTNIEQLIEIGFNDSYDSERFKEEIKIINTLLEKYDLKIQTKFIDANTEPEYRHSLTITKL
jgi:hypothetical protein|tara:strand:- start:458 stop:667 length:210 start_codon:yes stop_codon:yes gene_type:complete